MSSTKTALELGSKKISTLLRDYAVPAIIAMTASSLYNMVDSIYIGQGVGPLALSGLGVTFPLMNLSVAFGTLVGVGGSTMLSILLGKKDYDGASKVLGNIVSLNILVGILFMAVCLAWLDPILRFFGASDNTIGYASDYMKIILYGNAVTHLYFGLNAAMRSCGNPKFAMYLTLFTVILNAILDPVFIFTFKMGVAGAAIATVIAQVCALVIITFAFNSRKRTPHFEKGIVRFNWKIAKDSLQVGMGPFLMNAAACIVNIFINQQLLKYSGDLGIGAFGIIHRISFLFLMIVMGLNQGMQPIAGYNYGARRYKRVKEVYWITVKWAVGITSVGFIASEFFPTLMCRIFTSDAELLSLSSKGLRLMNIVFPIVGFQMVSTNFFQSLGMVNKSIFLSLSRQLLFLVPCLYVAPLFIGENGVWISFPFSDLVSSAITLIMILNLLKKFGQLEDGADPGILGGKLIGVTFLLLACSGTAFAQTGSADSTATATSRKFMRIYDYHIDRGPTDSLSLLDNASCEAIYGIDSTVQAYMRSYSIKGASLAVMRNDSLLYVRGYGWADKDAGEAMEPWHRMRVASVSKLVTAVGIMKMQEMGLLSLQDRPLSEGGVLRSLVPEEYDARIDSITVEHLLRHQAGFTTERGSGDPMFSEGMTDGDQACHTDLGRPLLYSPGTCQEYSNVGYYLLGVMIRRISGQSYEQWMKENVLEPMQCYNFSIAGNYPEDRQAREVRYYMHPEAKPDVDFHGTKAVCESCYGGNNVTGVEGAGGWMTTAAELCRMVAGIDIDSGVYDLLDRATVEDMTRFINKETYSLGWLDTNEEGVWTRTGSFGGTTAMVKYFSADGDCWVLLTNTSTCYGAKIAKKSSALIEEMRGKYSLLFGKEDLFYRER